MKFAKFKLILLFYVAGFFTFPLFEFVIPSRSKFFIKESFSNFFEPNELKNINLCKLKEIKYIPEKSTVIVGHSYGAPNTKNKFISKKVESFLDKNIKTLEKVIFTGDIFAIPSDKKWLRLKDKYSDRLIIKIAPGNHDVGFGDNALRDSFIRSFLDKENYPLIEEGGGFKLILEDSTISNWQVSNKIINFLQNINNDKPIILLRHHIPIKELVKYANSKSGMTQELYKAVELDKYIDRRINIISGDTGAFSHKPSLICKEYGDLRFIVNGIGDLNKDKIIILHKKEMFFYKI